MWRHTEYPSGVPAGTVNSASSDGYLARCAASSSTTTLPSGTVRALLDVLGGPITPDGSRCLLTLTVRRRKSTSDLPSPSASPMRRPDPASRTTSARYRAGTPLARVVICSTVGTTTSARSSWGRRTRWQGETASTRSSTAAPNSRPAILYVSLTVPGESVALSIFTSACISLDRTLPIDRSPIVGRTCRRRATSTLFRVLARVTCAACHAFAYWRTVVLAALGSMYCEVTMLAVVSSSQRLASTLRAKLRVF